MSTGNRITRTLADCRASGRTALTAFITAGDPEPAATLPALQALVAAGVDIIELGIPFSDPEAEGPAIQLANERALAHGTTLVDVLDMVRAFRVAQPDVPVLLMGYLNSVLRMGEQAFAAAAAAAGVDGLIMVNLPPEEAGPLKAALDAQGLSLVFLVAPTSSEARIREIVSQASGFVYYVSLKGTTGAGHIATDEVAAKVATLKGMTDLPVQVGFGIKDGASAAAVGAVADGVVVGSALVDLMGRHADDPQARNAALASLAQELRAGLDGG